MKIALQIPRIVQESHRISIHGEEIIQTIKRKSIMHIGVKPAN